MANDLELSQIVGTQNNKGTTSNNDDLKLSAAIAGIGTVTIFTTSPVTVAKETYLAATDITLAPDGGTPPVSAFTVEFEKRTGDGYNRGRIAVRNTTLETASLKVEDQVAAPLELLAGDCRVFQLEKNEIKETASAAATTFASVSEVRSAATGDKALKAEHSETVAAFVTLTDAATVAVDWNAFINGTVMLAGNRTLGDPTNGQIGTWRTIEVIQDGTGSRTLAFGANYKFPGGSAPTISAGASDVDVLMIFCRGESEFWVFERLDIA